MGELKNRRNASSFNESTLDRSVVDRVLEAGRLAPSAKNRQPWRFIAVIDQIVKEKLQDSCYQDNRITQSWASVVICTTNIDYRMPNGQLSYPMDIAFAASQMQIQAQHEGLSSALLTTFDEESIKDLLSVPYSMRIPIILLIGEPGEEQSGVQSRLDKKRVISFDHW